MDRRLRKVLTEGLTQIKVVFSACGIGGHMEAQMTTLPLRHCDSLLFLIQAKVVADLERSHGFAYAMAFLLEHDAAISRANEALATPIPLGRRRVVGLK